MGTDNVKAFYETLKADPSMVEEWKQSIAEAAPDNLKKVSEFTAEFAGKKGFDFSADDIREFESAARELSPEELKSINAAKGLGAGVCTLLGLGYGKGSGEQGASACIILGIGTGAWSDWTELIENPFPWS